MYHGSHPNPCKVIDITKRWVHIGKFSTCGTEPSESSEPVRCPATPRQAHLKQHLS